MNNYLINITIFVIVSILFTLLIVKPTLKNKAVAIYQNNNFDPKSIVQISALIIFFIIINIQYSGEIISIDRIEFILIVILGLLLFMDTKNE